MSNEHAGSEAGDVFTSNYSLAAQWERCVPDKEEYVDPPSGTVQVG